MYTVIVNLMSLVVIAVILLGSLGLALAIERFLRGKLFKLMQLSVSQNRSTTSA